MHAAFISLSSPRYSVPFFYEPSIDANINAKIPRSLLPPNSELEEDTEYYPYGAFLFRKLPIYVEYRKICEGLPEKMRQKFLDVRFNHRDNWATRNGVTVDGKCFMPKTTGAVVETNA